MSDYTHYDDLSPRDQALINEAGGGQQTVVSARMVRSLNGNGNAAILLSQLLFWSRTKADEEGWFFRTVEQMKKRCGLGKKAQKNAANTLRGLDLIETDLRGMPARKHYRVRHSEVIRLLSVSEQDRAHGSQQDRAHGSQQDRAHGSGPIYRQDTRQDTERGARDGDTAYEAYRDFFAHCPNDYARQKMNNEVDDLDTWRDVLDYWKSNSYRASSTGKMISRYHEQVEEQKQSDPTRSDDTISEEATIGRHWR
jgi:hypothetical protein